MSRLPNAATGCPTQHRHSLELLKQHPLVLQRGRTYLAEHERLTFSIITRYELLRGLKAKQATSEKEQVIEMTPDTFGFLPGG